MRTVTSLFLSLCLMPLAAGCGVQNWWTGATQGTLLQGLDVVLTPGQPVKLRMSLRGGGTLGTLSDYTVLYYYNDQFIGSAKTNSAGLAVIEHTFPGPGLYTVTATLDRAEIGKAQMPTAELLVGLFPPEQPMMIIDLDKTLVASGFDAVLMGEAEPFPHGQAVMEQLAGEYQVVYLTDRPDYLVRRSRQWLQEHRFPSGPLLTKSRESSLSSGQFKSRRLGQLKESFPNIRFGVGNIISDAVVYHDNGLQPFLLIPTNDLTPQQLRVVANQLEKAPADTQVIGDWQDLPAVLAGKADYSRPAVQQALRRLADERASTQPTRPATTQPAGAPWGASLPSIPSGPEGGS